MNRDTQFVTRKKCERCYGSGESWGGAEFACSDCKGKGTTESTVTLQEILDEVRDFVRVVG